MKMDAGLKLRRAATELSDAVRSVLIATGVTTGPLFEAHDHVQSAIDAWDFARGQSSRPRWIKVVEVDQTAYSATGIGLCEIGVTRIRVASIIVIRQHEIERGYSGLVLHGRDAPIWIKVAPDEIAEWIGDVG